MKNRSNHPSRRSFLAAGAATAGLLALPGRRGFFGEGEARAQVADAPALHIVFLHGGYNAIFCSADSFLPNRFGVTSDNIENVGSGVFVDKVTFGTMPAAAKAKMASIGVAHGVSEHGAARNAVLHDGTKHYPIALAQAMGGKSSIPCALLGQADTPMEGPTDPIGGVSLQTITDMASTIAALGGAAADPTIPDRAIAASALTAARAMSAARVAQNPRSLSSIDSGYAASIDTAKAPVQTFDFNALATAYGIAPTSTGIGSDFAHKMAAAELMIASGSNVVMTVDESAWDTHGDTDGSISRNFMKRIMPALNVWLGRSLAMAGRNVVTCIMGDFSRSLPASDHQPNLTATVVGKYVKQGTTGHVNANVALPAGTPGVPGLWQYLTAALKLPNAPFGANPHGLVL